MFRIWKAKKWLKSSAQKLFLTLKAVIPNHLGVYRLHGQLMDKHCLLDTQITTLEFGKCLSVLVNVTKTYFYVIYRQFILYFMFYNLVFFLNYAYIDFNCAIIQLRVHSFNLLTTVNTSSTIVLCWFSMPSTRIYK